MPEKKETLFAVLADTRGTGECRSCGASLWWYTTHPGQKWMPFDREPVPRKSVHDTETHALILYVSSDDAHWARCPGRSDFRKRS